MQFFIFILLGLAYPAIPGHSQHSAVGFPQQTPMVMAICRSNAQALHLRWAVTCLEKQEMSLDRIHNWLVIRAQILLVGIEGSPRQPICRIALEPDMMGIDSVEVTVEVAIE